MLEKIFVLIEKFALDLIVKVSSPTEANIFFFFFFQKKATSLGSSQLSRTQAGEKAPVTKVSYFLDMKRHLLTDVSLVGGTCGESKLVKYITENRTKYHFWAGGGGTKQQA